MRPRIRGPPSSCWKIQPARRSTVLAAAGWPSAVRQRPWPRKRTRAPVRPKGLPTLGGGVALVGVLAADLGEGGVRKTTPQRVTRRMSTETVLGSYPVLDSSVKEISEDRDPYRECANLVGRPRNHSLLGCTATLLAATDCFRRRAPIPECSACPGGVRLRAAALGLRDRGRRVARGDEPFGSQVMTGARPIGRPRDERADGAILAGHA